MLFFRKQYCTSQAVPTGTWVKLQTILVLAHTDIVRIKLPILTLPAGTKNLCPWKMPVGRTKIKMKRTFSFFFLVVSLTKYIHKSKQNVRMYTDSFGKIHLNLNSTLNFKQGNKSRWDQFIAIYRPLKYLSANVVQIRLIIMCPGWCLTCQSHYDVTVMINAKGCDTDGVVVALNMYGWV